jgi:uncharacterized delta-60 repeat protein
MRFFLISSFLAASIFFINCNKQDSISIAPNNLVLTISSSKINLNWDYEENYIISGFKIERSLDGKIFNEIAKTDKNTKTFVDAAVVLNQIYYYRLRAYSNNINSTYSNNEYIKILNNYFGNGFNNTVADIKIQPDGKILTVGSFLNYSGFKRNYLIRLNSNGVVDETFKIGTGFNTLTWCISLQNDGKIFIGGTFTSYNGTNYNKIIRLNNDGSVDRTFNLSSEIGQNLTEVDCIAIQNDGKIIFFTSGKLYRLNSDGSIDKSYNIGSFGSYSSVWSIKVQFDGKILVGGAFKTFNSINTNNFIRLNSDGSVDNSLKIGSGFSNVDHIWAVDQLSDYKIAIAGRFNSFNGKNNNNFILLNLDGTIDNTFNLNTGFDGQTRFVREQADGKIIIGGFFKTYQGQVVNKIIRLNRDGSLDNSFLFKDTPLWIQGPSCVAIQSDGKLIMGGTNGSNSTNEIIFLRLNKDGSIDN